MEDTASQKELKSLKSPPMSGGSPPKVISIPLPSPPPMGHFTLEEPFCMVDSSDEEEGWTEEQRLLQ